MRDDERFIQTYSGGVVHPFAPRAEEIRIRDIAHHLSLLCRFTGACREFYSVAQHSVLVSQLCKPEDAGYGLLHDAEEYVFADLNHPVKHGRELAGYRYAAQNLREEIFERFGLPFRHQAQVPESVRLADGNLLFTERRDLMAPRDDADWGHGVLGEPYQALTIVPWAPAVAEMRFLMRFTELFPGEAV
jgi:5'-nucleotidase